MNTEKELEKSGLPQEEAEYFDPMEVACDNARLDLIMNPPDENEISRHHMIPHDTPPIPHLTTVKCWCQPDIHWSDGEDRFVYRHRRIQ